MGGSFTIAPFNSVEKVEMVEMVEMVSRLTLGRLEPQACLVEQDEPCGSVPLGLWDLLEFPAFLP